jgi:hypothetical protein
MHQTTVVEEACVPAEIRTGLLPKKITSVNAQTAYTVLRRWRRPITYSAPLD